MSNIITTEGSNEYRMSHTSIAKEFGARQDAVKALVEKYISRMETLGTLPFQMEALTSGNGAESFIKVYYLNESQTQLLINCFKNTEDQFDESGMLVKLGSMPIKTKIIQDFKLAKDKLLENAVAQMSMPTSFAEALQLAADKAKAEEFERSQKLLALSAAAKAEKTILLLGGAKQLAVEKLKESNSITFKGFTDQIGNEGLGRNELMQLLRDRGILCKSDENWNAPRRDYIDNGWLIRSGRSRRNSNGDMESYGVTMITAKGQYGLRLRLIEWGYLDPDSTFVPGAITQ